MLVTTTAVSPKATESTDASILITAVSFSVQQCKLPIRLHLQTTTSILLPESTFAHSEGVIDI